MLSHQKFEISDGLFFCLVMAYHAITTM